MTNPIDKFFNWVLGYQPPPVKEGATLRELIGIPEDEIAIEIDDPNLVGISMKTKAEERPRFEISYSKQIDDNANIIITCYSFWGGTERTMSGELRQPNGRWVLFEPYRVADKILDPRLIKPIEDFVKIVVKMDNKFIRSKPSEYIDKSGQKWVKA